ncbi:uncharacterized protein LOC133816439 [Humulus lupulus]|uniref:uncharacterized protein LOC133816439 n=1 Tax=Humulus lupulus TaxID=3486 RepID=UPI002B417973|nr:uncharacterized protein LOC133816439 [Humulus lupulus]
MVAGLGKARCRLDEGEIDYVRVLNGALPNDMGVLGWCSVPIDFSARFSYLSREYKYFFWEDNLNLKVSRKPTLGN